MRNVNRALILLVLLLGLRIPAHAAPADARLLGPEVEIVDENGQPVANNTYFVECTGSQDLVISIEVQFVGGGVEFLSGEFCGAKIYIVGWIQLARIVAVASGPSVPHLVYLPILSR